MPSRPPFAADLKPPEDCLPLDDKQLTALFAGIDVAVYIEDLASHRILYWSPAAAALFGYPQSDVVERDSANVCAEQFAFLRGRGESDTELGPDTPWRGAHRFRRADGTIFEAEAAVSLLPAESGRCAVVSVHPRQSKISREIPVADRSAATPTSSESEIKNSAQSIGQLLRNLANYAVFTTDSAGAIREWNQEASRLLGYESGEVSGKPIAVICGTDASRALQKAFEEAKERGTSRYYQWMARKDGRRLYARVATFALWNNSSEVQGFVFLVRDDSREPSLRQILREKEQMAAIGTAAAILAHEIGNPLNGISATVQLLEHCLGRPTPPTSESLLSSMGDLKNEVKRLTALLSGFKNIAWPQKLALGAVDLKRLIQPLVGQIEKRSIRQNVEVSFACEPELPLLNGDDDKLKQALLQVLDNALDAMPHGGRLDIKAYQHEQTLCVDIIDTGVGIPKNFKVFDLFSSTKPEGIGLGLFMVQQIVLAHEGAITYSSTPGQGTTFHVTFALHAPPDSVGADLIDTL